MTGFEELGFEGPISLFDGREAASLLAELGSAPDPDTWGKGHAVSSPAWFALGTRPDLFGRIRDLLGEDVLLCSANLVERPGGEVHPWHIDAHLSAPTGRAVTAWVGLRNVSSDSSLRVVPGSHRFGFCPEERAAGEGRDAESIIDDDALRWAREADPGAMLLTIPMGPGDVVFFEAGLWHSTNNLGTATRTAALVQYATPDKPIRMHAPARRWPFTLIADPRPPCVLVSGSDTARVNRLVPAPARRDERLSRVLPTGPWFAERGVDWRPDPLFLGSTRSLAQLRITADEAFVGVTPHPPHVHVEEQLTIGVSGSTELIVGDSGTPFRHDLTSDALAYFPPGTAHGVGPGTPAGSRLIDISWIGTASGELAPLGVAVMSVADVAPDETMLQEFGRSAVELLAGPTLTLDRLRVLRVDMQPGFRGPPDVDAYDVVLLVRSGAIETLGGVAEVGDLVYYASGEEHRIAVVGDDPVELLVAELHSTYHGRSTRSIRRMITRRLPQPVRMRLRKLRRAISRVLGRSAR